MSIFQQVENWLIYLNIYFWNTEELRLLSRYAFNINDNSNFGCRRTTENKNGFSVVSGANNVNEPPILEPGGYPAGLPLSESTKVGTEVFVLKGHDPEGSPVKYGIQLTDHFVVNPRTGVITLAKPLNREVSQIPCCFLSLFAWMSMCSQDV